MPTFRVKMLVNNFPSHPQAGGKTREVVTNFVGCVDGADAEAKARQMYSVSKIKLVELVKEKKK